MKTQEKIKMIRQRMGLSQDELSRRLGVTQQRISQLEQGEPASGSLMMLINLYYAMDQKRVEAGNQCGKSCAIESEMIEQLKNK